MLQDISGCSEVGRLRRRGPPGYSVNRWRAGMRKIPYCCATALFLAGLFLTGLGASAQELDTAVLNFQVIRDYNGKPIRNASVVMHPVEKNGKQGKGGLQIKTDADGKASYEGAPYGKLRIQVLAGGFQTF